MLGGLTVVHANALGLSRRPGGVDDVGEIVGGDGQGQILAGIAVERAWPHAHQHDFRGRFSKARAGDVIRDQNCGTRILQRIYETFGGIGRVHRHIGTARLQDSQ